jgi:hypothetical protein
VAAPLAGVLLVLVCAAAIAIFTAQAGHRRRVLVMTRAVAAGTAIRAGDLGETRVASDSGVHVMAAARRAEVLGRVAAVNLAPGMLISLDVLTTGSLVAPGHAVVGLALKPGEAPTRLHALDQVMLIQTTTASNSGATAGAGAAEAAPSNPVLVASAQVFDVEAVADGQTTVVSVVVTTDQAPRVANASARDQISVVLLGGSGG